MPHATRWIFAVVGALVLWRTGISIYGAPANEVLFQVSTPTRSCVSANCVTRLELEVGNTGSAVQDNVRVRLRDEPLRGLQLPIKVLTHGKVPRAVKIDEIDGERIYNLGVLEPQKRVMIDVVFIGKASERTPSWSDILVAVEPAAGEAKPGDPSAILFARMMQAFFGWL